MLWDFEVQTDHHIEARRPDLIIVDKEKNTCQIVDFAIPVDHRVEMKKREKREKYQDLARLCCKITPLEPMQTKCYRML